MQSLIKEATLQTRLCLHLYLNYVYYFTLLYSQLCFGVTLKSTEKQNNKIKTTYNPHSEVTLSTFWYGCFRLTLFVFKKYRLRVTQDR